VDVLEDIIFWEEKKYEIISLMYDERYWISYAMEVS
jgi:hypothetical protein